MMNHWKIPDSPTSEALLTARLSASRLLREFLLSPPEDPPPMGARCNQCGLTAAHPKSKLDPEGVCRLCRNYNRNRDRIQLYFRGLNELKELLKRNRSSPQSKYDCLLLFSGGKDSTYALYQLIAMGLRVLTFTFDNGFLSRGAMQNITNITATLGVRHLTVGLDQMNQLFKSSLETHSTVCNGCFKGLLDRSLRCAAENEIGFVVTGLSRGQIMDERLSWFYERNIYDPDEIDRQLQEGRKVYHQMEDYSGLRLQEIAATSIFDRVKTIDFYRYCDATKDEIQSFLMQNNTLWEKPSDCGLCSSNCLINDTGVYVHSLERGYHNYESPTAWEVRLGHLSLDSANAELRQVPRTDTMLKILGKIGYAPTPNKDRPRDPWLVYCVPNLDQDPLLVKASLLKSLENLDVPVQVIVVSQLPDANGLKSNQPVPPTVLGLEDRAFPLFNCQVRQVGQRWSTHADLWQVFELSANIRLDNQTFKKALLQLILHHDCLRLQFSRESSECTQRFVSPGRLPFRSIDLSAIPAESWRGMIETATKKLASRDVANGHLLWRTACFTSNESSTVLLAAHEWLADIESWKIMIHDLETAYQQISAGNPVVLGPKTSALRNFESAQGIPACPEERQASYSFDCVSRTFDPEKTRAVLASTKDEIPQLLFRGAAIALAKWLNEGRRIALALDVCLSARNTVRAGDPPATITGFFNRVVSWSVEEPLNGEWPTVIPANNTERELPPARFRLFWEGNISTSTSEAPLFSVSSREPPHTAAGYQIDIRALVIQERLAVFWIFETPLFDSQRVRDLADLTMDVIDQLSQADTGS